MTTLIEVPRPPIDTLLRSAFIANAWSLVGLEAAEPTHRPTWLEILGPIIGQWDLDRPFSRRNRQGVSTCGLVAEGIWRRMNVDFQALYMPYIIGSSIMRSIAFAQLVNAWNKPEDDLRPRGGDYVVIGSGDNTHALTCTGWEGNILISVDGGQPGRRNLQAVKERRRNWIDTPEPTLGDMAEPARKVIGWVDISKLTYRGTTCQVPAGWNLY